MEQHRPAQSLSGLDYVFKFGAERAGHRDQAGDPAGVRFARTRRQFRNLRRGHARERRGAEAGVRSAGDDGAGREFSGGRREYRAARVELRGRDERRPDTARGGTRLFVERAGWRGDGHRGPFHARQLRRTERRERRPDQHCADADRADADPVRGEDQGPLRSRHQRGALHQGQQHAQSPLERHVSHPHHEHQYRRLQRAWTMDIESFRFPPGKK